MELLANNLGLFADSITMVGSGRIGFSLDPDRFGAPFSVRSDLDVVVVSERMFDEAWFDMLRLGRKCLALEERVRRIVKSHRESYIYWGFVIPDRLPGSSACLLIGFRHSEFCRAILSSPASRSRDDCIARGNMHGSTN